MLNRKQAVRDAFRRLNKREKEINLTYRADREQAESLAVMLESLASAVRSGVDISPVFTAYPEYGSNTAGIPEGTFRQTECFTIEDALSMAELEKSVLKAASTDGMWPPEYYGHYVEMTVRVCVDEFVAPTLDEHDLEHGRHYLADVEFRPRRVV